MPAPPRVADTTQCVRGRAGDPRVLVAGSDHQRCDAPANPALRERVGSGFDG